MKKKISLYLVLCCATLCLPVSVFAQGTLKGSVYAPDGKAAEFVSIGTVNYTPVFGTVTDEKGRYVLQLPSDTTLIIRFTYISYKTEEITVHLHKGEVFVYNFDMTPTTTTLNPLVINGGKMRSSSFTQIEPERLQNITGPNNGVEALLKTLPDVSSGNEMSSQYSVRGGSFDENLVYINGVEICRPILIRSGQQEGMSIINSDLIDHLMFSPGGFEASYGDKMSSVLDLIYLRPVDFKAKVSASFLGITASVQGTLGKENKFTYSLGFRQHSNSYLFKSLETEGDYTSNYTDLQTVLGYRLNEKIDLSVLGIFSRNVYELIPATRTTMTGGLMEQLQFDGYFDGQELDRYRTSLGAFTVDYHPSSEFQLKWITSVQRNVEREIYDVQTQYWLYEVNVGATNDSDRLVDRGVGTYLEHARNYLTTTILSSEVKAIRIARLGQWDFGARIQHECFNDQVHEWKWVDSAGYSMPTTHETPGDSSNVVNNPVLQLYCKAANLLATTRAVAYTQRSLNFLTRHDAEVKAVLGMRAQFYYTVADTTSTLYSATTTNSRLLLSPRVSVSYKPRWQHDILYRFAAGIYHQPPLYREYRLDNGSLNFNVSAQHSYQVMGTMDWNLLFWNKPFHLTTDIYYKYITDLIPYRIDNLRIRYDANNDAVAYATGLSVRLSGDFVEGLESWASLSLMQTQENLLTDTVGWQPRPTDQRISFKLFFQDYVPYIPFWRMSLNFIYGSGVPFLSPNQSDRSKYNRIPAYFRLDWGNTIELSRFERLKRTRLFHVVDDVMLSLEVFNLFNYRNIMSYIWVTDYDNNYYHIPNYLTARQFNLKLTVTF